MAHVSRDVFKRVIATDPYLIDGDFPAYVGRATLVQLFEAGRHRLAAHAAQRRDARHDRREGARGDASGLLPGQHVAGAVLDVDAALDALDRGTLAGLALDVLPVEPVPAGLAFALASACYSDPHAAFYSVESEKELRRKAAQNLVTWLATGRPDYVVTAGTRKP